MSFQSYRVTLMLSVTLISGCGGQPTALTPAIPKSTVVPWLQTPPVLRPATIKRSTSGQDLLYVSSTSGNVYVYTYPRHRFVESLTGFIQPTGECVDAAGDVFITAYSSYSFSSSTIYEYAHGGTTPIATLDDPGAALGCAVDPTTGNLAAANVFDNSNPYNHEFGSMAVYTEAQGTPTMYYSSEFGLLGSCGYDNGGALYLSVGTGGYQAYLARLASGSTSIELINLNKQIHTGHQFAPSVQWDGKHMTVSSLPQSTDGAVSVYRLSISGSNATVLGMTKLDSPKNRHAGESWIQGKRIIGIYNYRGYGNVASWSYPRGGNPSWAKKVSKHTNGALWGVTVSLAAR